MADDIGGVWRTIGGRRVFIKTGATLDQAMKESGKFKNLKFKKKKEDKEESSPRDAVSYFLKKGEFEKAEKYMSDYGLEDEREEFMSGLNYATQKEYKSFLSNKMSAEDIEKEGWGLPDWSPNDNRMIEAIKNQKELNEFKEKYKSTYDDWKKSNPQLSEEEIIGIMKAKQYNGELRADIKPVKNTNVHFATEPFKGSHLKEPKGTGIWAFSTDRDGNDLYFTPHAMSYSDAKKWVVGEMNKKGKKIYTLYVRG